MLAIQPIKPPTMSQMIKFIGPASLGLS